MVEGDVWLRQEADGAASVGWHRQGWNWGIYFGSEPLSRPEATISDFLNAIGHTPQLWRSLDIRVLAVSIGTEWHNVLTRCYLDSRTPDEVPRLDGLPVLDCLGCWQFVEPADTIKDLLKQVESQTVTIGGSTIGYRALVAPEAHQQYSFSGYSFSDLSERYQALYGDWSCHELTAMGSSVWDVVNRRPGGRQEIDNALRAHVLPFDGLDGLARHGVGSPNSMWHRSCTFEVFAPLEALLRPEECGIEKGRLHYAIEVGSPQAAQSCRLSIFALGASSLPLRKDLTLPAENWKPTEEGLTMAGTSVLPDHDEVTLFVSMGPYAVHRLTVVDPAAAGSNARVDAYRPFDPDLEWLTDALAATGSKGSPPFERAVARLLTLLGFQVDLLSGQGELGEGVDMLAYNLAASICIGVECTTASIGSGGKPGKLVARLGQVRQSAPTLKVWGMLVTPLPREQTSDADLSGASADDLIVVAQEDLRELMSAALKALPMRETLALLRSKIPPKPNPGLPFGKGRAR